MRRWFFRLILGGLAVVALGVAVMLGIARADPEIRTARIALAGWPAGAKPVRGVLMSDIHLGSRAMDRARLDRIVRAVNALGPDIVLIAGDFIAGHEPADATRVVDALEASLKRLRAPLGVVAVLGNHDHWTDAPAVSRALARAGVIVLENQAISRGPLAIGGVADEFTGRDRIGETMAQLRGLPGGRIVLTHSPDIAPKLPAASLLLAGHTHCGQIVLPLLGAPSIPSRYSTRYLCGVVREGRRTTIVTGGVGTSVLPLRFGAAPEVWVVTFGGVRAGG